MTATDATKLPERLTAAVIRCIECERRTIAWVQGADEPDLEGMWAAWDRSIEEFKKAVQIAGAAHMDAQAGRTAAPVVTEGAVDAAACRLELRWSRTKFDQLASRQTRSAVLREMARDALEIAAALAAMREGEAVAKVCEECGGDGCLGRAPDGRLIACEHCGGHEDALGRGVIPAQTPASVRADAVEVVENVIADGAVSYTSYGEIAKAAVAALRAIGWGPRSRTANGYTYPFACSACRMGTWSVVAMSGECPRCAQAGAERPGSKKTL